MFTHLPSFDLGWVPIFSIKASCHHADVLMDLLHLTKKIFSSSEGAVRVSFQTHLYLLKQQ